MVAKCKFQKPKDVEPIVLVYHEQVNENSELMKDLENKYLPSIVSKGKIKPKTFKQFCNGKISIIQLTIQIVNCKL